MNNVVVIHDAANKQWLKFSKPVKTVMVTDIQELQTGLKKVLDSVEKENLYAVGFICYEASPAFDSALKVKQYRKDENSVVPLLWFSLYNDYEIIEIPELSKSNCFKNWTSSVDKDSYNSAIKKVKNHILEGDTYQVNYTLRQYAEFDGSPWDLFCNLTLAQQSNYSAFIDTDEFSICSVSPELFFTFDNGKLTGCPMKGTAARGLTNEADKNNVQWLYNSEKNRAENLMIVDMIRNDFGRVAKTGSVTVPKLFNIEKYPTVLQMTSNVEAETDYSIFEVIKALFPCASITGAPKAYTMKIISELETEPRGLYTGSIGFITPENRAQFNVAIRTVVIDKTDNKAEYGVGGGIVWDSTDKDEYMECIVKSKVLEGSCPSFSLLESLLWTPDNGYFLLDYHMDRLLGSAEYFDYKVDETKVIKLLNNSIEGFPAKPQKVRLLVSKSGTVKCENATIELINSLGNIKNIAISNTHVNSNNPFLYHKTTNRSVYESAKADYSDLYDVLLWNERGELTESCRANLVLNIKNNLYTPPVSSGLLGGTFRRYLLETGKISEKILLKEDLVKADEIFLINSVRKWEKAVLDFEPAPGRQALNLFAYGEL